MMERLTTKMESGKNIVIGNKQEAIDRLAYYEDMEEQGRLVVLPCKIGDVVYTLQRRFDGSDCIRKTEFWWSDVPQLGKTVFLDLESAENALKGGAN